MKKFLLTGLISIIPSFKKAAILIAIFIVIVGVNSCKKKYLNFDWNFNRETAPVKLIIKQINSYPSGSNLLITEYISIFPWGSYSFNLPLNDTIIHSRQQNNLHLYYKWKILNINNDSLSGGQTPTLITTNNSTTIYSINF